MTKDEAKAELDDLSLACQKVGLFLHKFALLEHEMNERIVDILQLKDQAAGVVAHGLDFFKKFNLLKTVAIGQRRPPDEKKHVGKIFSGIARSKTIAPDCDGSSCLFEPAINGSVQFRYTLAKDGKVDIKDPFCGPRRSSRANSKSWTIFARSWRMNSSLH